METAIAKGTGPMVLTGGTILAGTTTPEAWLIPVFLGVFAVGLTAFLIARSLLTRRGAASTAHGTAGRNSR